VIPPSFELTPRQQEAISLLAGPSTHCALYGGSRSGKTFALTYATIARACKAPGSSHTILRSCFNHLKSSVILDTFPKVMEIAFPGVPWKMNKSDWYVEMWNGSRILFGGLDDKERADKILGQEHSTVYLNECSQISYSARNKVVTRLAQKSGLKLKAYYDLNPPTKAHWTYRLFQEYVEPSDGCAIPNPADFASLLMNPGDNLVNIADGVILQLESLPAKDRARFLLGKYLDSVEGALWRLEMIKREAAPKDAAAKEALRARMRRIVVAVDPSGCSGPEDTRSDEIGIVVCGLDRQDRAYILADRTGHYSPEGWARATVAAMDERKTKKCF
jgi:hypothetical protein